MDKRMPIKSPNPNRIVESYEAKQTAIESERQARDRFLLARGPGHFGDVQTMRGTGLEEGARG